MKKTVYNAIAYKKGNTGRKGQIIFESVFNCMTDAIKKIQEWVYLHEDLYYYTIERKIIVKNE